MNSKILNFFRIYQSRWWHENMSNYFMSIPSILLDFGNCNEIKGNLFNLICMQSFLIWINLNVLEYKIKFTRCFDAEPYHSN